ncbi:MAG: hypothetical protein HY507_00050 [Candidatus Zambryskibacteria bacterium]|nr:hypothetical protein [Candidatus Zambryskibacteria bacterium]
MLVTGSNVPLEIGKTYSSLFDQKRILRKAQSFLVIRESNLEEWTNSMRSLGEEPSWEEIALPCKYYYEIQTD